MTQRPESSACRRLVNLNLLSSFAFRFAHDDHRRETLQSCPVPANPPGLCFDKGSKPIDPCVREIVFLFPGSGLVDAFPPLPSSLQIAFTMRCYGAVLTRQPAEVAFGKPSCRATGCWSSNSWRQDCAALVSLRNRAKTCGRPEWGGDNLRKSNANNGHEGIFL